MSRLAFDGWEFNTQDVAYYTDCECATICERCGAPIAHVTLIIDIDGTEHFFGSTCGQRVLGNAAAEKATREAMKKRHCRDADIQQRAVDFAVRADPAIINLKARIAAEADPVKALHLQYELECLKRKMRGE